MPIQRVARAVHEADGAPASLFKYIAKADRIMSLWLMALALARSAKS